MFMCLADKCAMCLLDGWGLPQWPDPGKTATKKPRPSQGPPWKIWLSGVKGKGSGAASPTSSLLVGTNLGEIWASMTGFQSKFGSQNIIRAVG